MCWKSSLFRTLWCTLLCHIIQLVQKKSCMHAVITVKRRLTLRQFLFENCRYKGIYVWTSWQVSSGEDILMDLTEKANYSFISEDRCKEMSLIFLLVAVLIYYVYLGVRFLLFSIFFLLFARCMIKNLYPWHNICSPNIVFEASFFWRKLAFRWLIVIEIWFFISYFFILGWVWFIGRA